MANIDSRAENNNFCARQFNYFRGMEAEQYSFYRVPKVLFTAEYFQTLSCEAKVLYGLMLDRMSLSIKNRWLDGEDRVCSLWFSWNNPCGRSVREPGIFAC